MAISGATPNSLSSLDATLKIQYYINEMMLEQFLNYSAAYDLFKKGGEGSISKQSDGGLKFYYPLKRSGEAGVGTRGDLKVLPNAQAMSWTSFEGKLYNVYMRGEWSGVADEITRDSKFAYGNPTKAQVHKELPKAFSVLFGQMFHRDGTGAMARVNGAPAGNTLTVYGNHLTSSGYTFATDHMRYRLPLSAWEATTRAQALTEGFIAAEWTASTTVNSYPQIGDLTVDVASSTNILDGYYLTVQVNDDGAGAGESPGNNNTLGGANQFQLEYTGLGAHITNNAGATVHNILKSAANQFWRPATIVGSEGSATAFSWLSHVLVPLRSIENRIGTDRMGSDYICMTRPEMMDRISTEFDGTIRGSMGEFDKAYGYKTLKAQRAGVECKFYSDPHAPGGCLRFIDKRVLVWQETRGPHVMSGDGLEDRMLTDKDAYQTGYRWIGDLACVNPGGLAAVYGLSST
mgnify:CR=1 FL=1